MTPPPGRQPTPWVVPDLFRWFGLLMVSAVGITVAWWGASGTTTTSRLITWVNVGVAAVVVGGLANMTWLLQGRRAVAARRRQLLQAVPRAVSATSAAPDDHGLRVAVPGGRRYHRPECAAVDGKPVERMPVPAHVRAGRRPCGLCDG